MGGGGVGEDWISAAVMQLITTKFSAHACDGIVRFSDLVISYYM